MPSYCSTHVPCTWAPATEAASRVSNSCSVNYISTLDSCSVRGSKVSSGQWLQLTSPSHGFLVECTQMYTFPQTVFCGKAECKCVVRSADTEQCSSYCSGSHGWSFRSWLQKDCPLSTLVQKRVATLPFICCCYSSIFRAFTIEFFISTAIGFRYSLFILNFLVHIIIKFSILNGSQKAPDKCMYKELWI